MTCKDPDCTCHNLQVIKEWKGYFKSVELFNNTIHVIIYPADGLKMAAELQKIEEGTPISLTLQTS
jgi:hypothetical protein